MSSISYIYSESTSWPITFKVIELQTDIDNSVVDSTTDKQVLSDFSSSLDNMKVDSGLLPPGLRLSIPGFMIFERPPTKKIVQYIDNTVDEISCLDEEGDEIETSVYEIPIPWQLYMVTYSTNPQSKYRITQVNTFFMNTPLSGPDTVLYAPYVHNFFSNGILCSPMFDSSWEVNRYPQNLSGVMASAYDWVWNTGFNADLKDCVEQTIDQSFDNHIIKSFREKMKANNYRSRYNYFYEYISQFSPEDVVSLTWSNVSYSSYHDQDYRYIWNNDLLQRHYPYFDPSIENYSEFKETVNHPSFIKKTYSDIIKSTFFIPCEDQNSHYMRNYSYILNQSNNSFSSVQQLAYHLRQHILVNSQSKLDN